LKGLDPAAEAPIVRFDRPPFGMMHRDLMHRDLMHRDLMHRDLMHRPGHAVPTGRRRGTVVAREAGDLLARQAPR
jgi:hypothetical protein